MDTAMDYVYPGSSVAELKKGDVVTPRLLVEGMLLPSGNDAAYVLAIAAKGTPDAFVAEMNDQAGLLGMTGSHFANPDGKSGQSVEITVNGSKLDTNLIPYAKTGEKVTVQVILK